VSTTKNSYALHHSLFALNSAAMGTYIVHALKLLVTMLMKITRGKCKWHTRIHTTRSHGLALAVCMLLHTYQYGHHTEMCCLTTHCEWLAIYSGVWQMYEQTMKQWIQSFKILINFLLLSIIIHLPLFTSL